MKFIHMLVVALLVAASPTQVAAQDASQAGSTAANAADHPTPAVRNGLLWLAGLGLVGVMVERVKRRRV